MTFDIFWAQYPIKKGKVAAQRAWNKISPTDSLLTTILKALEAQKKEKQDLQRAKQFVPAWPHASTWLNGRRWEDEITTPVAQVKLGFHSTPEEILKACREKGIDTYGRTRAQLLQKLAAAS